MQIETVMTFGLGDALFGLPVTLVQEIFDPRPVMRLPNSPHYLLGVIDVRGTSVVVVDLRRLLGEEPREDAPDTRIVVLLLEHGGEMLPVALRVDRVIEVADLDTGSLESVSGAGLLDWDQRVVEGIGRRNGAFVMVLRLGALFDRDVIAAMASRLRPASFMHPEAA